jgi:hypothetical protein
MRNRYQLSLLSLISLLAGHAIAQQTGSGSVCGDYYSGATRNVALEDRRFAEQHYQFNQHCEKNGEVRSSSLSGDVDAVVKGIPFKFGLDSSSSKQKLQEFCRVGAQAGQSSFASTSYRNEVVEAAYKGMNECFAIERQGLRVRHTEQPPEFVYITASLDSTVLSVTLDNVSASSGVTCTSTNFSSDGSRTTLDGGQKLSITRNFNIQCTRTPNVAGSKKSYPGARIGLATSLGPYTVTVPAEETYGIELASEAARQVRLKDEQIRTQQSEALELQRRLKNPSVTLWGIVRGEEHRAASSFPTHIKTWKRGPRPTIEEWLAGTCTKEGGIPYHQVVGSSSGNCCGYT